MLLMLAIYKNNNENFGPEMVFFNNFDKILKDDFNKQRVNLF